MAQEKLSVRKIREVIRLKQGRRVLINTSRSGLIDTEAVVLALKNRTIAGAAFDVYDIEPIPLTSPLLTLRNLQLTPHIGFKTAEALKAIDSEVVENVRRLLRGDPLNQVNLDQR